MCDWWPCRGFEGANIVYKRIEDEEELFDCCPSLSRAGVACGQCWPGRESIFAGSGRPLHFV